MRIFILKFRTKDIKQMPDFKTIFRLTFPWAPSVEEFLQNIYINVHGLNSITRIAPVIYMTLASKVGQMQQQISRCPIRLQKDDLLLKCI